MARSVGFDSQTLDYSQLEMSRDNQPEPSRRRTRCCTTSLRERCDQVYRNVTGRISLACDQLSK